MLLLLLLLLFAGWDLRAGGLSRATKLKCSPALCPNPQVLACAAVVTPNQDIAFMVRSMKHFARSLVN